MRTILAALLLLAALTASAATKYVDLNATGAGNGSSWADAWTDVDQITGLSAGDTVLIGKGTYGGKLTFPTSGTDGNPITFAVGQTAPYNGRVYITNATGVSMSKNYVTLNGALDWGYSTNGIVNTNLWGITNNIGIKITCADNTGISVGSGSGVGLKILWCEIGPCGSTTHSGNENGIYSNGTDPGPMEVGYCWFHDNIYGDTINIAQNDTRPLNDIVIHHSLMYNTGDDFIQAPGGTTIAWNIMRERTASYSSGHTDILQGWGGGSFRSQGFPDKSWGNLIFHHNEIGDTTGGTNHYGSWSLLQFSGKEGTNIFVYNNLMCDHHETNASSSAGFGFTADGFYDTYNPGCTFSNVIIANNLWNSLAHQALVFAVPQGLPADSDPVDDDWRLGSGEANTGGRGFIAGMSFTNFYTMNNIAVDMYGYPQQLNYPVISIPYTNVRSFTFTGGSNEFTGETFGETNVTSQATYDPVGFDFRNNVIAGTNSRVSIIVSNGWATAEALDSALGYTGNKSTRPSFVNYTLGSAWNFRLGATDTAAKNSGTNLTALMSSLPDFNLDLDGVPRPDTGNWDIGPYQTTDTNLLCWLAFESGFEDTNYINDWSDYEANGLQYGWTVSNTNWPTRVAGKSGSYAAQFTPYYGSHPYADPDFWDGQFAAITNVNNGLTTLTQATFAVWCKFSNTGIGNNTSNHTATILDGGYGFRGGWHFGRYYSTTYGQPYFLVVTNSSFDSTIRASWPTIARDWWYTNNAWIHLAATVDCATPTAPRIRLYMDGTNVLDQTYTLGEANSVDYLSEADPPGSAYGKWIAVGCWTHNGTPPLSDADGYPNNGWLNGALDDVRIYNRILDGSDIAALAGLSGGEGGGGEPPSPVVGSGWDLNTLSTTNLMIGPH